MCRCRSYGAIQMFSPQSINMPLLRSNFQTGSKKESLQAVNKTEAILNSYSGFQMRATQLVRLRLRRPGLAGVCR
jgi:hypothetical protein